MVIIAHPRRLNNEMPPICKAGHSEFTWAMFSNYSSTVLFVGREDVGHLKAFDYCVRPGGHVPRPGNVIQVFCDVPCCHPNGEAVIEVIHVEEEDNMKGYIEAAILVNLSTFELW